MMKRYLRALLNGTGQVMFQENIWTGLLFLAGIAVNSTLMCLGGLLGLLVGTITGLALKGGKDNVEGGLFGFNGILVGIALLFFFSPSMPVLVLIVMCSALSTAIMMGHKRQGFRHLRHRLS